MERYVKKCNKCAENVLGFRPIQAAKQVAQDMLLEKNQGAVPQDTGECSVARAATGAAHARATHQTPRDAD